MPEFRKYLHVERYGNTEVQGIELGECYVFPKLDGTNASVWCEDYKEVKCGSRNRELTIENDNAGFCSNVIVSDANLHDFVLAHGDLTLYGEWLVPHTLKTYRDECWRKFYVFDVWDWSKNRYLHYKEYQPLMEEYRVDYLAPICIINSPSYDNLLKELENNKVLIKDGEGCGEGIVLKNYNYVNKYGRTTWAKILTNEFKEKHNRNQPTVKKVKDLIEIRIVDKYITNHLVDKVYAKIVNEQEGWSSKYIPRLLNTVYNDLIREEMWDILKEFKNPIINFKTLNSCCTKRVKELKPEVF